MRNNVLRTVRVLASVAMLATNLATLPAAAAEPAALTRADLQRHDLGAAATMPD